MAEDNFILADEEAIREEVKREFQEELEEKEIHERLNTATITPSVIEQQAPAPDVQDEDAALKQAIAESIADVEKSRAQMASDQVEIDRLREETKAIISRLLAA